VTNLMVGMVSTALAIGATKCEAFESPYGLLNIHQSLMGLRRMTVLTPELASFGEVLNVYVSQARHLLVATLEALMT